MVNKELGEHIELFVKMNKRTFNLITGLLAEKGIEPKNLMGVVRRKKTLEELWEKFSRESEYITLDRKLPLKTIACDFVSFVLKEEDLGNEN